MAHDQGYLRFFAYMSFFSTSKLGLVTSSNLIQIYIFWELVGLCSYLLIGFWFTRPVAANACQKASFEFRDLFKIFNNLIYNNELNFLFVTLCAVLLFAGAVAKSAQFSLLVLLPNAMKGPTPISALIHAATMEAAGIFLVARLLPLFRVIPYIMMLALGMGSYRSALFHLITHAYSKTLLILGSGSIIHSMETIVGYSPAKSQNMGLMGGL
uniref:NADH:quinone oxidoreductase/Mrp antiporter transmembrane domain-containing protein n=1 Tax=Solanum lycopersicum TaxID=4081 RepID=K4D768_SOLLC